MPRRLAAALLFLIASSAHAQWLAYDDAVARAKQEQKPILLYLRVNCDRCNRDADAFVDAAETHEAIVRAYAPFVRARIESMSKAPAALRAQQPPAPAILIVTPDGTYAVAWRDWNLNRYTNFLRLARDRVEEIGRAADLRATDAAEADLLLADAVTYTLMFDRARELFHRAEENFLSHGNHERVEYAHIGYDFAAFFAGDRKRAYEDLASIAGSATAPRNMAFANNSLGMMDVNLKDLAGAVRAYRAALDAAPEGSTEAGEARAELQGLGYIRREVKQEALIQIVAPPRATITGGAQFSAMAIPAVKRVAWSVDGVTIASSDQPPFTQRLNLGDTPRMHKIGAVAYSAAGEAIAEAVATVNDRIDFRVALVSPVASTLSGKTVVEASVEAPPDHHINNVELFWNETKLGTYTTPPYRASFDAPNEFGYFRAVATLDDGRTAEEARVVNSPAVGETLDVHTIAFAATVKNRSGQRISGLTARDFKASDNGESIALKVRDEDEPVTIGLAVDASASMRSMLLDTIETASNFVSTVASPHDRVFLVAFDNRPHLLQSPSSDRDALKDAIFDIMPAGETAIVDAIAFSLQQFTGLTGKKALVVITDGLETNSEQTAAAATRMARESGVPIYVFIPRGGKDPNPPSALNVPFGGGGAALEAQRRAGLRGGVPMSSPYPIVDAVDNGTASPLLSIANASGGTLFYSPKEQTEIFARIRDEVRGQYLLSFPSKATKAGVWRDLRVSVERSNATVRTITGYYAR
jgi:VWFA-related protein